MLGLTYKRGGRRLRLVVGVLAGLSVVVTGLYAGRAIWLRQVGGFLIRAQAPEAADLAVVLAGDGSGHRILKAVDLVRQGYVKRVLVDGPRGMYGYDESALAIRYAVDEGAPKEIFIPLPMRVRSTIDESRVVDRELRKRNVRAALVVTSNFHTRRAGEVFRSLGSPVRYIVVAAPDEDFRPEDWWHSREAQKVVVQEYAKLLYWWWEK